MYFKSHPKMTYNNKECVNIFHKNVFINIIEDEYQYYEMHTLMEGETPETVALKYYGDMSLHWIVILLNSIINIKKDWPLDSSEMDEYILKKYPGSSYHDVHHYIDSDGDVVDDEDGFPVSNLENALNINEAKRNIKIVKPEYVGVAVKNFKDLMGQVSL